MRRLQEELTGLECADVPTLSTSGVYAKCFTVLLTRALRD